MPIAIGIIVGEALDNVIIPLAFLSLTGIPIPPLPIGVGEIINPIVISLVGAEVESEELANDLGWYESEYGESPALPPRKVDELREYIRALLVEQNVLAAGMCFPFAAKKAEEWFDQHFEARRGRAPKRHPDLNDMDKFKVVHGKVTDQWKKPPKPIVHAWVEMGDLVFDDQTRITKPDGVPKDVYYDMYQPEVVKEYNAEEVVVNCVMKGEGPWDEELRDTMKQRDAWLNETIRELLKEDPMGFVHDVAAASEEFGEEGEMFFGGDPGKGGGKAIKRAFNANADHKWLSTLDTIHWGDPYTLTDLAGRGKDELSATMTLPGEEIVGYGKETGLWVKGRITLAANDMDQLYSGHNWEYGPGKSLGGTEEEVAHRDKSSGRNKRPTTSKDYSRYGKLERGNEFAEKMARNIPYILDQSTWDEDVPGTNEALVDNWSPIGIVPEWEIIQILSKQKRGRDVEDELELIPPGKLGQVMKLAQEFGVPIFDRDRNELWSPE